MRGVNKAILLGNLAGEPEFRVTSNGTNMATVGLATNENYRDANGNMQEQTEWHRLVFWGHLAEIARDYLHKGNPVYIEGKIKTRSYDDKQGVRRYVTEIQVLDMQMLGSRNSAQGGYDNNVNPNGMNQRNNYPQRYNNNSQYQQNMNGGYQRNNYDNGNQQNGMNGYDNAPNGNGYARQPNYGTSTPRTNFEPPMPAQEIPRSADKPMPQQPQQAMPDPSSFKISEPTANPASSADKQEPKEPDMPFKDNFYIR